MLYFTNLPNFNAWLSLLLEILGNMWIAIICYPVCDVRNFEINLSFFAKPFLKLRFRLKATPENVSSSVPEKVKQHLKIIVAYKKACNLIFIRNIIVIFFLVYNFLFISSMFMKIKYYENAIALFLIHVQFMSLMRLGVTTFRMLKKKLSLMFSNEFSWMDSYSVEHLHR